MRLILGIVAAATLHASPAGSQMPAGQESLSFTSISIHESRGGGTSKITMSAAEFAATTVTVRELVGIGYDGEIVGGPDWIDIDRFDILATLEVSISNANLRPMVQHLLRDRFGLVVTPGTVSRAAYTLEWFDSRHPLGRWLRRPIGCDVAPPDPPELMLAGRRAPETDTRSSVSDAECRGFWGYSPLENANWFYSRRNDLSGLVGFLSRKVGTHVVDMTNLKGQWDLDLKWEPELALADAAGVPPVGSIRRALRDQLGLEIEPTEANVEAVVIQDVRRPLLKSVP
jgi:uncharacterized protein (TIGR03435 family)